MDIYGFPTPTCYNIFLNIKLLYSAWVTDTAVSHSIWVTDHIYTYVFEFFGIW
jgi:hypothetical protein